MLKKFTLTKSEDINLDIIAALNHCAQSIERLSVTVLNQHSITVSQFNVLEILHKEGALKIRDIIDRVLSTGGNMTVVIKNLEKNGLINREADKRDRRATLVSLSKKGLNLISKVSPEYQEFIGSYLNRVTKKDKEAFLKLSQTIRDTIQEATQKIET